MRIKDLYNVDNNTMKRDIIIINSNDGLKNKSDYKLTITINDKKMEHSFKVKSNSIELQSISIFNIEMQKEKQLIVKYLPLQTTLH